MMFRLLQSKWGGMSSQFVMTSRLKRPKTALPLAFTEHGVVMLSSILHSETAIHASILVVRAFVAMRQLVLNAHTEGNAHLQREVKALQAYFENLFEQQNDINENTRIQLEAINQALAELHTQKQEKEQPRRRIGYIQMD